VFNFLSDNLGKIFDKLRKKGALTQDDIESAMREIRIALIEADVSLPAIRHLVDQIKIKALGAEVVTSITPGQMVVKIVNDELTQMLTHANSELQINYPAPVVILMSGLQGSGKTTTSAKLALRLKQKYKKKVLLASTDIRRPAAQKQLEILGKQIGIDTLDIIEGQKPLEIAKRAIVTARAGNFDVVIIDTSGRMHIDDELMDELKELQEISSPKEVLLVVDSMIGQDAVNMAKKFSEQINITGFILTKMDGDARGGAALSMKFVTGLPIKFIGTGEKINEIDEFRSASIASRILNMGDIVSLVEKMSAVVDEQESEKLAKKIQKGNFDMNDFLSQMKSMQKMGGISSILGMMPGLGKLKVNADQIKMGENTFKKQKAIIESMTLKERRDPKIINPSRKHRIAKGSGTSIQEVNRLLKQHLEMCTMMKKMDMKKLFSGLKN
jgi:signal recognition particle subunit SRP54